MLAVFLNIGILIAYLTGAYLPYDIVPGVLIVFPVIFVVAILMLPETPRFLIRNNQQEVRQIARFVVVRNILISNLYVIYLSLYRKLKNHLDFTKDAPATQPKISNASRWSWKS